MKTTPHPFWVGWLIAATSSLLCARPGQAADPARPKPDAPVEVTVTRPVKGNITRSVTLPGEIKPYQQATLCAKVTGYLKSIKVDKGDAVAEGALLAEIEAPELLADAAKCRAELAVAQIDHRRVSEAQTKAPDLVVPLSVDTAKGRLEVAKASLERAETLLAFTRITAPFAGVITRRMVDPGAFIPAATAGNPVNAALMTVADFNVVRVQVAVPEVEASLLAKGQPVSVRVDGLPGRAFEGQVTRFAYALEESTKTMLAEVELPNPKLELRPGMYARVQIGIERRENVPLLPVAALVTEKAGAFVFTLSDSKARKTPIKTGFNDGTKVEVVSGLDPTAPVLVPSGRSLADGQAVRGVEPR
jgi:membrane fusion protein (multidrug efflux system)